MTDEGRPRRADARANRDRILAAAEEVFARKGQSASTEEVAATAGLGIGTVFRHFPAKRDLVEATLVRHFEQLAGRVRALAAPPRRAGTFRLVVTELVTGAPAKLALWHALMAAGGGQSEPVVRASQHLGAAVGDLLAQAQQVGEVRPDVHLDDVYFIVRGLSQAATTAPPDPDVQRRVLDIVFAGLAPEVAVSRDSPHPGSG